MVESAVGPVRLLDPGPALFVEKDLPSCSSLFPSASLPVFPVSVAEGEAEVHRAVAEGVLRGTSSSSTIASPHAVAQSSKRSVSTAVAPKTNSARSTVLVDSGQGFAMENFVHVHEVMEGCREVLSWNWVLSSWHSSTWTKRGSGHAKIILDTEFGLRYFLFQKHGSTKILGYFFREGRGFCDLNVNAGNDKCWVWSARDRSQGEDAESVVMFALLFSSSELALQFKVAFDEVRALNRERLGI